VKHWIRYIDHKKNSSKFVINQIYERALKQLPGSYKLWYNYLKLRKKQVKGKCITDDALEDVNNAFERSLVFMHKMPRIWMEYLSFITDQCKITRIRHTFDRALRALPITQHNRIWPLYLAFINKYDIPETGVRVYRRYLRLYPEDAEEFIDYLTKVDRLDEAAQQLASVVDNEHFTSKSGKSNHQLWNELCDLISKNPDKVHSLNVDAIIRSGLRRYTDQLGHLWCSLASYYLRSGLFERARDIYEEAIETVTTVRDFSQIFDAYAQFEELSLSKLMEEVGEKDKPTPDDDIEIDLRLARFENLMERRMALLNSVLLRQNPHNVQEWHNRVKLFEGKPLEIIKIYTEAVQTVQPKQAVGRINTLWVEFAKFYEVNGQVDDARTVFKKASQVEFAKVDDLASIWCEWAELEIRQGNVQSALDLMYRATVIPKTKISYTDESETVQARLHKSLKLWSMYADLEESFGTFKTCKSVYDRIIDLRICTPQIIINYGMFLEEHNYFEEAFRAYEKGISLFKWPNVFDIWNTYLTKFLTRYGGKQLERARDLLEQCIENCPPDLVKNFYLLYAKLEEDHGLARHVINVYERAVSAVQESDMFDMFNLYIKKAAEIYGIARTRPIYEKAIEMLPEAKAREMCVRFSEMETKLGEIDRARVIYSHCSQMCDPRVTQDFWQQWKDFEIRHGNEDTMREMLRIKRSVQATFNTQVNMMTAQIPSGINAQEPQKTAMQMLESRTAETTYKETLASAAGANIMFVRGEVQGGKKQDEGAVYNPDEIDIDMDDDDDEVEGEEENVSANIPIQQKPVPSKVFGGLKKDGSDSE
jgi:pre-mRNA-splicing factor SYF1